jgi:cyclin-dependent kinase 9
MRSNLIKKTNPRLTNFFLIFYRIDADTALNHDFFWTDPMPCDLSKMLSQHTQSMFEYLAPPRRTGQMLRYQQQMGVNPMQPKPQDNSYQDRVY